MGDSDRSSTEDEANTITSKPPEEDSIDHHFIPTYLRVHGSHLTTTQVASVALTLFTIGISSESDLHDVDAQLLADICRDEKSLSHLDHARTRQFLTHRGSPHFPQLIFGPSFTEGGLPSTSVPISVPAERRGRKSGVVLPADFGSDRPTVLGGATPSSTGRHRQSLSSLAEVPGDHGVPAAHYHGTEPVIQARTRHSQSFRYLGGTSARQHQTDLFASSGGGPGGLGEGNNIHHVKTALELETEQKKQQKLEINAEQELPMWDGTVGDWREFSKDFLRLMATVGKDIVCRPEFTQTAQDMGWTPHAIVAARKFVWKQLFVCCKDVILAKNALSLAAAEYDGETAFYQLEIDNKVSSIALKTQHEEELRVFVPQGREDPPAMIVRFDVLLNACLELESADQWDPEKKINTILNLLRHWEGLHTNVDLQRERLTDHSTMLMDHIPTDRQNEPHLMSYTQVCRKARSIWNSFVVTDASRTKIREGCHS
jgi:hypothetical protein